jgi:hypothetical protein
MCIVQVGFVSIRVSGGSEDENQEQIKSSDFTPLTKQDDSCPQSRRPPSLQMI